MEQIVIRLNPIEHLELSVNENRWTQVCLIGKGQKLALGAEDCSIILSRLAKLIGAFSTSEANDKIEGIPVIWVLSLSELHSSLFWGKTSIGETVLFVQNGDGTIIGHLQIDTSGLKQELERIK